MCVLGGWSLDVKGGASRHRHPRPLQCRMKQVIGREGAG